MGYPTFYPQNCPFPFDEQSTPIYDTHPSTDPTHQPGIQIQSAVLRQFTHRTDRPTDRFTDEISDTLRSIGYCVVDWGNQAQYARAILCCHEVCNNEHSFRVHHDYLFSNSKN